MGLGSKEVQGAAEQLALTANIFAIKSLLEGKKQSSLQARRGASLSPFLLSSRGRCPYRGGRVPGPGMTWRRAGYGMRQGRV